MKTIVITGGTKGIGSDIARKFLSEGWDVLIGARQETGLALEKHERLKFKTIDVKNESEHHALVKAVLDWTGSLDCFINCAGFSQWSPVQSVSDEFWNKIIKITNKYHQERKFVCLLGYEWSGNTSLGGDRNVIYNTKKGPIYRSSFSLLKKNESIFKSASNVNQLHKLLDKKKAITIPHVGGRYSDINNFFNPEFEKSIEIHSAWGTFEWLLFDAIKKKYKVFTFTYCFSLFCNTFKTS